MTAVLNSGVTIREALDDETRAERTLDAEQRTDLLADFFYDAPAAPCEPVDPTAIEALAWWAVPVEAMAAD